MRCRVRNVLKKRCVRVISPVLTNESCRLVADRIGVEELWVLLRLGFNIIVATGESVWIVETARANDRAVKMIEPALKRPGIRWLRQTACDVPLTAKIGDILVLLEHFGDRHATLVQITGITFRTRAVCQNTNPSLMRVEAGQQRSA